MNSSVPAFINVLNLNTRLYKNCLTGVDDVTAQQRPNDHTNNLAFLACHLVDARYYLSRLLGAEAQSPFHAQLAEVNSVDQMKDYPTVAELLRAWDPASRILHEMMFDLTEEDLAQESPRPFPIGDSSLRGAICFLLQHESFHIGQMALLRKFYGAGAMTYTTEDER